MNKYFFFTILLFFLPIDLFSQQFRFEFEDSTITPSPKANFIHFQKDSNAAIIVIESNILLDNSNLDIFSNVDVKLYEKVISKYKKLFVVSKGKARINIIVGKENKYNYSSKEIPKGYYYPRDSIWIKINHIPRLMRYQNITKPYKTLSSFKNLALMDIQSEIKNIQAYVGKTKLPIDTTDIDHIRFSYMIEKVGKYDVTFKSPGYKEITNTILLHPQEVSYGRVVDRGYNVTSVETENLETKLTIFSIPNNAKVFLNNEFEGKTPMTQTIRRDSVKVQIQKVFYKDTTKTIYLTAAIDTITFKLEKTKLCKLFKWSPIASTAIFTIITIISENNGSKSAKSKKLSMPPYLPNH